MNRDAPPASQSDTASARDRLPELAAMVAAVVGHLPVLGAWWNLADWSLLARAAGLAGGDPGGAWPARWLSRHLYWDLTWPLFGLHAGAHAVVRLILHGLAAALVVRIARRGGLGPLSGLLAGLVFAASPLAFAPLYTASGIQELLAAVLALAAVDRWLAGSDGGRSPLLWATVLAALSILSMESGLGLPLLFLGFAWLRVGVRLQDKTFAWAMIMLLLPVALAEGVLLSQDPATAGGAAYATGDALTILGNLGRYGWWLMSPGPRLAGDVRPMLAGAGVMLFVVWAAWGVVLWRRRHGPLVLLALFAALLVVGPALPWRDRLSPGLIYLGAAPLGLLVGAVAHQVGFRQPRRLGRLSLVGLLAVLCAFWGFFGMRTQLGERTKSGLVANPIARATSLSWQACRTMRELQRQPALAAAPGRALTHLTLLQPLVDTATPAASASLGERWTRPSEMYRALGGTLGPRLVLGADVNVEWANGLTTASSKAVVLCETPTGFRIWGNTVNALLYAALTEIGLGHFERARSSLVRAAELGGDKFMFVWDEGRMVVPLQIVLKRRAAFIDWTLGLLDEGASRIEVGGLQDLFLNILRSATGRSIAELTVGSHLVSFPSDSTATDSRGTP